ncbi:MAG: transposase [Thermoplasmataceae archaeon]
MILGNAKYHHAKLLLSWLEEHKELLFLDYPPECSPKLNPMERVCKLLKRLRLHNQYFPNLNEVVKIVAKQFLLWMGKNSTLRTLCSME